MLCERCHKRSATLRYSEVIDGKAIARNICETCRRDIEGNASLGFEMSGAAPAPRPEYFPRFTGDTAPRHVSCPSCGTELAEALKTGRVGCGLCYDTFAEQFGPVLRSVHPSLIHRGRTPRRDDTRERLLMDLQSRRALLRSALKTESFEDAAVLRDEIKRLEASLGSASHED